VLGGHHFKRIRRRSSVSAAAARQNDGTLLELIAREVVRRFARIIDVSASAVPWDMSGPEDAEDPPPNPSHPACEEYADSDYCRESWLLHRAELQLRPETHWHKCDRGRLCAIVPIVCRDRCLAAVKLACPASLSERDFERQVELLDLLAKDFAASRAKVLGRMLRARTPARKSETSPSKQADEGTERRPRHPQILRAIQNIEAHLSDPGLSIGRVARQLDLHPTYLSQLFVEQVGQRMNRFIASRRVELAKTLLATTDWQVKLIAYTTGYANPNWFSHVFRTCTGLTPEGYRKKHSLKAPGLTTGKKRSLPHDPRGASTATM
jgi:AraC-like DNA-binding protein